MENAVVLKGSDKQIAWAEQIRIQGLAAIESWLTEFERQCTAHNSPADQVEQARKQYLVLRDKVASQDSAAWWINNRGAGAQSLLKAVR